MANLIKRLWTEESGVTALEYALLAGIFIGALGGLFLTFKDSLVQLFNTAQNELNKANGETG